MAFSSRQWTFFLILLAATSNRNSRVLAFSPITPSAKASSSSTTLRYREDPNPKDDVIASTAPRSYGATKVANAATCTVAPTAQQETAEKRKLTVKVPAVKPLIETVDSLDGLKYFLDGDDRLAIVKFYAPWCKTCKKLETDFNHRFATSFGDVIDTMQRRKIAGQVRLAQVEFHPTKTKHFIQNQLNMYSIPTIQVYYRNHKVWELCGVKSTKELTQELQNHLFPLMEDPEEWETFVESVDDEVFINAIEESLFDDSPEFLSEEW